MNADKFNSPVERDKRLKMRYSHPEKHSKMEKSFDKHNAKSKALFKAKHGIEGKFGKKMEQRKMNLDHDKFIIE